MDIQLEKFQLIEALMKIDDMSLIEEIKNLVENKANPIMGFDIEGKAIPKAQLINQIEAAEERIDSGEFISQENLEKESESW